ncbi:hypothetical protein [Serratia fonticola]|uniref:hypothetical protein n=1 Tax=Serratia fonticola TaxID=47917 RepID=UPI002178071E|nr:hypothetical protein [Serratia fonticola]CAI1586876.1 Uncharacterised protein [Serratia fonticola]CAI1749758.1 Uncharacterised protein [Serratia fonticola]CAI1781827.1 Uncharacterised protein [Serratia fonticola]
MKKIVLIIIGLVLSSNAVASDDIKTYSYCSGLYQGIYEYQPQSNIGKEARQAIKYFQHMINETGSLDKDSFESGKSIGLKLWSTKNGYKNRPKMFDTCFDSYSSYIRTLSTDELMKLEE